MAWTELWQVLSYLLFSLVLLVCFFKCNQLKNKLTRRRNINTDYVRIKGLVAEYLNEKEENAKISRFETISRTTGRIIIRRLKKDGGEIRTCCSQKQLCQDEEALKDMFRHLLKEIEEKMKNKEDLVSAVQYEFKRRLMKHPFDIIGSRRAFVVIDILHNVLGQRQVGGHFPVSYITMDLGSPLSWHTAYMKTLLKSIFYTLITFFLMYSYDWVTDVIVLHENNQIIEEVFSMLTVNGTLAELDSLGISPISIRNSIPGFNNLAGLLLIISTLITLPKLKHLKDLINVRCTMTSPFTETSETLVDIKTVIKRHDASLLESSTESMIQIMIQWGSYLGLIYLIDKIMYARNKYVNILCSEDYYDDYILEDIICTLNDTVEFRSKAILWFSGLGSILSLTLSQLKAHNIQHEFCTNWKMKAAYICAAFANTVSYIFLVYKCS